MDDKIKCIGYLRPVLEIKSRQKAIGWMTRTLRDIDKVTPFEAIAFRGLSGGLVAPSIADRLKKPMIAVRKRPENNHSDYTFEGYAAACNYIIVDDLISTGDTIHEIITAIPASKCVGIILYQAHPQDGRTQFDVPVYAKYF